MGTTHEKLLWAEVDDIGDLLHELTDEEFDRPSLCEGWRVRDVIGHMSYGHTTPMPAIVLALARFRFDIPRGSFELSKQWASARRPAEIGAFWDRELVGRRARRGIARTIRHDAGFLDHFVHHQDIRRPLDRPRVIAEDRLRAALDLVPAVATKLFDPQAKVDGLRLVATDVDWSHGDGPKVEGPGEALVMAASGRGSAIDQLRGEGVATLTERVKP